MHYLITGGNGFIGSHLTLKLLEQGHRVTILDNFLTSPPDRLENTNANVVKGSVLDENLVYKLSKNCDYIIHMAAIVGVRLAMKKGIEGLTVSYVGTDNVLKAATKYDKEILVVSSSSIYGKITKIPVSEDADCLLGSSTKSSWLYSVAKLVEEHLALAYFRELGTKIKICRFFNVIGPHQSKHYGMVVPTFIDKAYKNEPLPVYGNGKQTRTFAFVEDVIKGIELVLEKGVLGDIYNIGGTEEIKIMDLAEKIKSISNSSSPIELIPYEKAFDKNFEETSQRMPDISKIKKLGYNPLYTLDQSILEIINFKKSRGEI